MTLQSWIAFAAIAGLLVLAALWWRRPRGDSASRSLEAMDTIAAWPPEPTRIMSTHERLAYHALVAALPDTIVLAQVPLARFVKVPRRHSYTEWIKRVGHVSADFVVCDRASMVLAVISLRSKNDSERSQRRHARKARVLEAAGIVSVVWNEGAIPGPEAVRSAVLPREETPARAPAPIAAPASSPLVVGLSTLPLPSASANEAMPPELAASLSFTDPPPSTWFDEFESSPAPLGAVPTDAPKQGEKAGNPRSLVPPPLTPVPRG